MFKNISNNFYFRVSIYILIFIVIFFMSINAPLGASWLPWHLQKILNLSNFKN